MKIQKSVLYSVSVEVSLCFTVDQISSVNNTRNREEGMHRTYPVKLQTGAINSSFLISAIAIYSTHVPVSTFMCALVYIYMLAQFYVASIIVHVTLVYIVSPLESNFGTFCWPVLNSFMHVIPCMYITCPIYEPLTSVWA